MSPIERDLDKTLTGRSEPTEETAPLVDVARRLEGLLDAQAPDARRERAIFATAVATRRKPSLWRFLAPAIAITSLLAAVYFAGRAATPGNALYPVRKALQQVDLAPQVSEDVGSRLREVQIALIEAETIVDSSPRRARLIATDALKTLGATEELIDELPNDEQDQAQLTATELERRAVAILSLSLDEEEPEFVDEVEDRTEDSRGDDSGSDDSGSDDSSGSGSGDDSDSDDSGSDDSSGSGSGDDSDSDDSGSDDSSGSGSGDDSDSDDSSGSGSGSDDKSGSGSDDD